MASLDVSEALDCADFQTTFSILRRADEVNDDGENVIDEADPISATGVVQAATARDLERVPEAFRSHEGIKIYYKGLIIADETGFYSDIIVYKDKRWQVLAVDDWGNYGAGYVKVLAIQEKASNG